MLDLDLRNIVRGLPTFGRHGSVKLPFVYLFHQKYSDSPSESLEGPLALLCCFWAGDIVRTIPLVEDLAHQVQHICLADKIFLEMDLSGKSPSLASLVFALLSSCSCGPAIGQECKARFRELVSALQSLSNLTHIALHFHNYRGYLGCSHLSIKEQVALLSYVSSMARVQSVSLFFANIGSSRTLQKLWAATIMVGAKLVDFIIMSTFPMAVADLPFKELPCLQNLTLSDCGLERVPEDIRYLSQLRYLNLSDNSLTRLPIFLTALKALETIELNSNSSLVFPPIEVVYKGSAAILSFLEEASRLGEKEICLAKLLFVGRQGVGKSSLQLALRTGEPVEPGLESTLGIKLGASWKLYDAATMIEQGLGQIDVEFRTWDFAGQEEYYSLHRLFLSTRAIYLLVVDLSAPNFNYSLDRTAQYWVEATQAHAPGSQIIVIGSKADCVGKGVVRRRQAVLFAFLQRQERLELTRLRLEKEALERSRTSEQKQRRSVQQIQQRIVEIEQLLVQRPILPKSAEEILLVSSTTGRGIEDVRARLLDLVLPLVQGERQPSQDFVLQVPESYANLMASVLARPEPGVEDDLREPSIGQSQSSAEEPILQLDAFAEQYQEACLFTDRDSFLQASSLLHELGLLLHFRNKGSLKDLVFLKPQWLIDQLKDVFVARSQNPAWIQGVDEKLVNLLFDEGILDHKLLPHLMPGANQTSRNLLLSLLEQFKLAYPTGKEQHFVPARWPEQEPAEVVAHWDTLVREQEQSASGAVFGWRFNFHSASVPMGFFQLLMVTLGLSGVGALQERWQEGAVLGVNGIQVLFRVRHLGEAGSCVEVLGQGVADEGLRLAAPAIWAQLGPILSKAGKLARQDFGGVWMEECALVPEGRAQVIGSWAYETWLRVVDLRAFLEKQQQLGLGPPHMFRNKHDLSLLLPPNEVTPPQFLTRAAFREDALNMDSRDMPVFYALEEQPGGCFGCGVSDVKVHLVCEVCLERVEGLDGYKLSNASAFMHKHRSRLERAKKLATGALKAAPFAAVLAAPALPLAKMGGDLAATLVEVLVLPEGKYDRDLIEALEQAGLQPSKGISTLDHEQLRDLVEKTRSAVREALSRKDPVQKWRDKLRKVPVSADKLPWAELLDGFAWACKKCAKGGSPL